MTRRLAPVPDTPRRMLGLIRVSKERDEMISPENQLRAITDFCVSQGHVLADVIEGLDESGSQRRSAWWPRLDQAVDAVEQGRYDGIVVWKFSRTARHRRRWAIALDRVEVAGGILESATEQFDTTTSAGRFARGVLAEFNAFEAERIGETWKEAHATRVRSGRPHTGKARFGYVYNLELKLHVPHPEQGPLLAEMYRRYVAGGSVHDLVVWLNRAAHRTTRGNLWSDATVRKTLDSGFGGGMFIALGTMHQGAHEPVITPEMWQAYQDARLSRRSQPSRRIGSPHLLSGLVRCARCGFSMVAYAPRSRPDRKAYRCSRCPELGKGPMGYVAALKLETAILDHVRALAAEVDDSARSQVLSVRVGVKRREVDDLEGEVARAEAALVRLAVSNAEQPLPGTLYEQSRAELTARLATLMESLEQAGAEARRADPTPRAAAGLLEAWDELPVSGRREILRQLIDCVLVRTGRPAALRVVGRDETKG